MSYLSKNLIHLRKDNELTQEQFSAKLGINRKTYSAWEEGRCEPKISTLKIIADFHRITIDDLCFKKLEYNTK
jgi:DNA-binding XRE family transcriptional regulator